MGWRMKGLDACRMHGPNGRTKELGVQRFEAELVANKARSFLARLGDFDPLAADPVSEVLRGVQRAAAMEAYYRSLLAKREEQVGEFSASASTNERGDERPSAIADLLGQWSDRAFTYSKEALRLGIEKKRVEDQQAVGAQFAKAIMRVMYDARLGLTAEQRTTLHALWLEELGRMGAT